MWDKAKETISYNKSDWMDLQNSVLVTEIYLKKYGWHLSSCPANNSDVCTCHHLSNQHFSHGERSCAHCNCKKFTVRTCTCGFDQVIKDL